MNYGDMFVNSDWPEQNREIGLGKRVLDPIRDETAPIEWRCSEGSSTGSRRIGFWKSLRGSTVCFIV